LAIAATIGIGMVIPSSGSAASPRDYYSDRANAVRTYTPPEGQIDVRGFRDGRARTKGASGFPVGRHLPPMTGERFEPRSIRTSLATLNDPALS
jgi:hypothetical protein